MKFAWLPLNYAGGYTADSGPNAHTDTVLGQCNGFRMNTGEKMEDEWSA
jgi:hypothetical protein